MSKYLQNYTDEQIIDQLMFTADRQIDATAELLERIGERWRNLEPLEYDEALADRLHRISEHVRAGKAIMETL